MYSALEQKQLVSHVEPPLKLCPVKFLAVFVEEKIIFLN